MGGNKNNLTRDQLRWERFAHEFIIDLNATKAAARAGFSTKCYSGLKTIGCHTLARPEVQEMIAELQAKRIARLEVKQDDVVRELALIAFSDTGDMFDDNGGLIEPKKWPKDLRRSVQAIEVFKFNEFGVPTDFRVRFWDKNKALTQLGLHMGMFGDKDVGNKPDAPQIEKNWTMEFIEATAQPALPAPNATSNGKVS